ncbi:unnamed protein product [Ascophyllum nodosum]
MNCRNSRVSLPAKAVENWSRRELLIVRVLGIFLLLAGGATAVSVSSHPGNVVLPAGAVASGTRAAFLGSNPAPVRSPRGLNRQLFESGLSIRRAQGVLICGRRAWVGGRGPVDSRPRVAAAATAEIMDDADAAKIIDGKATAAQIRKELTLRVADLVESTGGLAPGLAVVLVGDRRDSATYVRMKKKACEEVGIKSFGFDFPDDVTHDALLACVVDLNARADVHGILVQLPLPKHIDEQAILHAITPDKDVDGLHPTNVAALCAGRTRSGGAVSFELEDLEFHVPCTPQGCIELLDRYDVQIAGRRAVVLGRSNIVGLPVSRLLMHRDATVTVAHSKTVDVASVVKEADIVVCAAGRAEMVKADWIKPGAAVIDVGINSVDDPTSKKGYRLVGDVDFEAVKEVASKITPVPGGVGPMTIAMLLRNTVNAATRAHATGTSRLVVPAPPVMSAEGAV